MKIYYCSEKNTHIIPRSNLMDDEKDAIDFGDPISILFQFCHAQHAVLTAVLTYKLRMNIIYFFIFHYWRDPSKYA